MNITIHKDNTAFFNLNYNEQQNTTHKTQRLSSVTPMLNTEFKLHESKKYFFFFNFAVIIIYLVKKENIVDSKHQLMITHYNGLA